MPVIKDVDDLKNSPGYSGMEFCFTLDILIGICTISDSIEIYFIYISYAMNVIISCFYS